MYVCQSLVTIGCIFYLCNVPCSHAMEDQIHKDLVQDTPLSESATIIKALKAKQEKKSIIPESSFAKKIIFFTIESSNTDICHRIAKIF